MRQQTYKDYEIILVDDGSTEDLSQLGVDCYVKQPELGISVARNRAMGVALGDYYFILDSDDTIEENCLEELINNIGDYDAIFPKYNTIDIDDHINGDIELKVQTISEMMSHKKIPHSGLLIKKESVGNTRYSEEFNSAIDLDFTAQLLIKGVSFKMLDKKLLNYRLHDSQESKFSRQANNALLIREKYRKYL